MSTRLSWLGVGMGKHSGNTLSDVSRSLIFLKRNEGIDCAAMKTWS